MKQFPTKVVGVTSDNPDGSSRQEIIREQVRVGDDLDLIRQPDNPYDKNAIAVFTGLSDQIGYLSREVAREIAPEIDRGMYVECTVLGVTGQESNTLGVNIRIEVMTLDEAHAKYPSTPAPAPIRSTPKANKTRKANPNPKSPKSILILLVLWFTLGYIGGHRWYAGRGSWLYTLTFGYILIGWIVDFFVIVLGRFEDKHGRQIRWA